MKVSMKSGALGMLAIWIAATGQALASFSGGVIARVEGPVSVLTHPGAQESGPEGTLVKYQGTLFLAHGAKAGETVKIGDVVKTTAGGRARIVFENGDSIQVAEGTSYRVIEQGVRLYDGKLRAIIQRGGPRSKMVLRTRSAIMGVRGTDFVVEEKQSQGARLTVLRGKVEVAPQVKLDTRPFLVKAGLAANTATETAKAQLAKPTKSELTTIVEESKFGGESARPDLESKTVEISVADLKADKVEVAAATLEELDQKVLMTEVEKAPEKAESFDLDTESLKGAQRRAYDKFFKNVQ